MSTRADEALKSAVRRSLPILIGLIVVGVLASNSYSQAKGPSYQAVSQVQVSATPLSSIITGTQAAFVDPQRSQDTALALAASPQLYQLASRRTAGRFGSAGALKSAISVAAVPDTDILAFTAASPKARRAVGIANAVAAAYVAFRSSLTSASIAGTIAKLQQTLAALPPTSAEHNQVQGELNRVQLLQGASSSDSTVIQSAVSASKTAPAPLKDSLLGLSAGLVVALLLIGLREAFDTTVRSEGDVEDALSRPVLASVRRLPRRQKIVTYGRHEAMFADAYSLLAAQLSPTEPRETGTVLAVTSALSREGKTTTAVNLAVAAARRGARVLLVDFDFRKSELSALLPVPEGVPGALQVLGGSVTLEEALWNVALDSPQPELSQSRNGRRPSPSVPGLPGRATGAGRTANATTADAADSALGTLQFLPAGGMQNPRRASERPALAPLIRELRHHADLIVIDTPPALITAEMTELAELIDLALVVVRQGYLSRRSLRSLARHVRTWRADLAGAVLTDVPSPSGHSTYYGAR
jgi:non-specific protein-tyrosine kinase